MLSAMGSSSIRITFSNITDSYQVEFEAQLWENLEKVRPISIDKDFFATENTEKTKSTERIQKYLLALQKAQMSVQGIN